MTKYRTVYVTCANKKEAQEIGTKLVEAGMAACANILDNVLSIYKWEGETCQDNECILLLKTSEANIDKIILRIKELHSYAVPAILSWKIVDGNPDYFDWMDSVIQS